MKLRAYLGVLISLALVLPLPGRGQGSLAGTPKTAEVDLVAAVESAYTRPTGPRAPGASAPAGTCSLVLEAHDRWHELSPEARARLAPLLAEPEAPAAVVEATGPSAPVGWIRKDTGHFALSYARSGGDAVPDGDADRNGTPDYVDEVARYLESSWDAQTRTLGYTAPSSTPIRVYLRAVQFNGLTHHGHPGGGPDSTPWLEICSDIVRYNRESLGDGFDPRRLSTDPAGLQAGLLKAVCAHEFFHIVQLGYSRNQAAWWREGSADWMGSVVFPESGFYLNNTPPHLDQPHRSLLAQGDFMEYSASLFATFLAETQGGPDVVRRIWEACRSMPADAAVGRTVGDLREVYPLHVCYNYLRAYRDGTRLTPMRKATINTFPSHQAPRPHEAPEYLGANVYEITPAGRKGTLSIKFSGNTPAAVRIITIDRLERRWTIRPPRPAFAAAVTAEIPDFGGRIASVCVVVARTDPEQPLRYTLAADVR